MREVRQCARAKKRAKKMVEASFLNRLLALDSKQDKRALIEKHNPYFYTLFKG